MKTARTLLTAAFLIMLFTVSSFGADKKVVKEISNATVESLIDGLQTDNLGLKTSSAQMVGDLKIDQAVIPLMAILHSDKNEDARISAALALYKIGDAKGIFAVKQAIRFDESDRVRKLCSKFYNGFVNDSKTAAETNVALK